jgi:predicted nuclease of predicted toxin-antitoxin system
MKFLANENIPFPSIDFLLKSGLDIISVARLYSGITDEKVIQLAIQQDRTIITMDSDYGELIYRIGYKPVAGVLFFRIKKYQPNEIGFILLELLEKNIDFRNKLVVVDENSIRERRF